MSKMKVGIVGHGGEKFNHAQYKKAMQIIAEICDRSEVEVLVSGASPLGGIDIWAQHYAEEQGILTDIKEPMQKSWEGGYGYRARNMDIAKTSDVVHVIVMEGYNPTFSGRRFEICYHCTRYGDHPLHIKSGGCWTGWKAFDMGKKVVWHIIKMDLEVIQWVPKRGGGGRDRQLQVEEYIREPDPDDGFEKEVK